MTAAQESSCPKAQPEAPTRSPAFLWQFSPCQIPSPPPYAPRLFVGSVLLLLPITGWTLLSVGGSSSGQVHASTTGSRRQSTMAVFAVVGGVLALLHIHPTLQCWGQVWQQDPGSPTHFKLMAPWKLLPLFWRLHCKKGTKQTTEEPFAGSRTQVDSCLLGWEKPQKQHTKKSKEPTKRGEKKIHLSSFEATHLSYNCKSASEIQTDIS